MSWNEFYQPPNWWFIYSGIPGFLRSFPEHQQVSRSASSELYNSQCLRAPPLLFIEVGLRKVTFCGTEARRPARSSLCHALCSPLFFFTPLLSPLFSPPLSPLCCSSCSLFHTSAHSSLLSLLLSAPGSALGPSPLAPPLAHAPCGRSAVPALWLFVLLVKFHAVAQAALGLKHGSPKLP